MSLKHKAVYLTWDGYVDSKLKFSQFFAGDHTIMAWFMPQYPYAYAGPLFSENSQKYIIGQADYRRGDGGHKDPGSPVFMVQMDNKEALYLLPEFQANKWQHIAVVRQNHQFKLYVNGVYKTPVEIVQRKIVGMGIAGSNDHVYAWYQTAQNSVSSGNTTDLDVYRQPYPYKLPPGKTSDDIVDCAIAGSNDHVYVWFKDGTVCSGSSDDLDKYRQPYPYKLPPGKTPQNIVGIGIAGSNDHVYAWYNDGTVSSGSSDDLDKHLAPYPYSLPPGKTPQDILGIDIASDDHVYTWYKDHTVSSGTSGNLDKYQEPVQFKFPLKGADMVKPASEVVASPNFIPGGTLRFGRSGPAQPNWQAFGLLDDLAVFDRALTLLEIKAIRDQKKLDGKESGLLAGWVFDEDAAGMPSILKTWHKRSKRAYLVPVSANRNNQSDAQRFNDPMFMNSQVHLRLPFPPAQEWQVTQGFDSAGGSHNGFAAFTWDFKLNSSTPKEPPIFSSVLGRVAKYLPGPDDDLGIGLKEGREPYFVKTEIGKGEYLLYLHLKANSLPEEFSGGTWDSKLECFTFPEGKGPLMKYYSSIGKYGAGANHLHMGAENSLNNGVTIPIAFNDYEVKQNDGSWKSISRGIPQSGEVIRNPPTPKFVRRSLQVHSAVARSSNQLDVVATDTNGRVWIAHWQPNTYEKNWDRWHPVLADIGIADFGFSVASFSAVSPVSVVARDANKLDVFMAGQDGKTYTGARDQDVADGLWRGWWNILQGAIPPDGTVTAVSRAATKLDVFHVSNDGKVYTAAWDKQTAEGEWRGWWPIKVIAAKPGSPVAAIVRTPNKLDIFVTGKDGKVYTAAWDKQAAKGEWQGWWPIGDLSAPSGAPVSVVSRGPDNLDIFVVGNDGRVYTTAWAKHAAGGKWQSWRPVKTLTAKPGTPVAAVSRESHNLDIFTLGSDNKVYTAAWDKHVAEGQWRGWWPVGDKSAKSKSAVAAVSRSPTKLDIFIVGSDGKIHTAAWDPKKAKGEWQGWWSIGS